MFGERHRRRKRMVAVVTPNSLTTVGVHPLVAAEVRELRVRLVAGVAAERLDAAVYVLVLFQAAGRRERFAATGALVLTDSGRTHLVAVWEPHWSLSAAKQLTAIHKQLVSMFALLRAVHLAVLYRCN